MTMFFTRRCAAFTVAAALLAAAFLGSIAADANAQATRTWISGVGDDANPCSRTAPCKTLPGAISKTAEGGEINALDPGGFGGVTITKSITIDLSAAGTGGVLVAGTNAIVVNAAADDNVVLRGLDVFGAGTSAGACRYGGLSGVLVVGAGVVRVDDSSITQMRTAVRVAPTAADTAVLVNRVDISNNCAGVAVEPAAGRTARVGVQDSTITNSGTAVRAADGAQVWVSGSTIFSNALGFEPLGTGAIDSFGDNRVYGNGVDGTPTRTLNTAPPGPAGPAGPAGPHGPPGLSTPQGDAPAKLLLALVYEKVTAKVGKRVRLPYVATAPGDSTLEVRKGRQLIATVKGRARAGQNTIAWNGKRGRKAATAGRYTLTLRTNTADGQTATSTARLTVKR